MKSVFDGVSEARGVASRDVRFHLFGVAKMRILRPLARLRVASVDSASHLRKAWLRSGQNYLAMDGKWYTAIRIPQLATLRFNEDTSERTIAAARVLEARCLEVLGSLSNGGVKRDDLNA